MPNLLTFLPAALGQGTAQVVYGEVTTPAPTSFTDPLYVTKPDWSTDIPFTVTDWPAVHGLTLPLPGDAVLLIHDSRGLLRCVWWDGLMTFSTQTSLAYYLTPTASDVTSHNLMLPAPYSPKTTSPVNGVDNGQVLQEFVTQPLVPGLSFLPAGQFEFHVHAQQVSGNQTVQVFAEFWECTATGTLVDMIGQSQNSLPLTFSELEYRLFFTTANVYALASPTSRLMCHLKAIVGGTGGANVAFYVGGTADSHAIFPTINNAPVPGTAWITPSLTNSWTGTFAYLKDPLGFVTLRGNGGTGSSATSAFTLPAGYRPGVTDLYPALQTSGTAGSFIQITTSGQVIPTYTTGTVYLNNIRFLAEN